MIMFSHCWNDATHETKDNLQLEKRQTQRLWYESVPRELLGHWNFVSRSNTGTFICIQISPRHFSRTIIWRAWDVWNSLCCMATLTHWSCRHQLPQCSRVAIFPKQNHSGISKHQAVREILQFCGNEPACWESDKPPFCNHNFHRHVSQSAIEHWGARSW